MRVEMGGIDGGVLVMPVDDQWRRLHRDMSLGKQLLSPALRRLFVLLAEVLGSEAE